MKSAFLVITSLVLSFASFAQASDELPAKELFQFSFHSSIVLPASNEQRDALKASVLETATKQCDPIEAPRRKKWINLAKMENVSESFLVIDYQMDSDVDCWEDVPLRGGDTKLVCKGTVRCSVEYVSRHPQLRVALIQEHRLNDAKKIKHKNVSDSQCEVMVMDMSAKPNVLSIYESYVDRVHDSTYGGMDACFMSSIKIEFLD